MESEDKNEILEKLNQLETAILGRKDFRIKGILDFIHDHEERLEALEEFKKRITWQSVAIAGFAVFLAEILFKVKDLL